MQELHRTIEEKLRILTAAARYDVSCSSSGSDRTSLSSGVGNVSAGGICHSWSADGRCISLLKVLMSNDCKYDCAYCQSRHSNNIERTTFTPAELTDLMLNFYIRNYIEGLFLSSAVYSTPDQVMQDMITVAETLRTKHKFGGYIHIKVIPGCNQELITRAGRVADRLSVNIELPSEMSLKKLAPQKQKDGILKPMAFIGESYTHFKDERKRRKKPPLFAPGGQSTQLIVGASNESDYQIIKLSESLYNRHSLKRVYYSAYMPVNNDSMLPAVATAPPLQREHRLYQADWLVRFYGFQADEILSQQYPSLDLQLDPKAAWALRHFDQFPVDVNRATYEMLLRVPGIGVKSAQRIIRARSQSALREEDLKPIGIVMKRAKYFITVRDKYLAETAINQQLITHAMTSVASVAPGLKGKSHMFQPTLF